MFIVGVDVGGTFTDVTAVEEATGRVVVTKVPSQARAEGAAVLAGLAALGIASRDVRRLVHGTTVATNAVLERRGARVALLTTAGFRDLIEIGRASCRERGWRWGVAVRSKARRAWERGG